MYADQGKLDEALTLATVAQEELRQRPEAEDTLGWVYRTRKACGGTRSPHSSAPYRAPPITPCISTTSASRT